MQQIDLSKRMGSMSESATLALNARAKQLMEDGKTIYNLTAGELASDTPPYVQEFVGAKLAKNKYTAVAGMPELRTAIADNARQFYDFEWIEAHNVVVTAGAKPALYASLLALINPGDEVIVPVPAWTTYNHLIELVGGKVVEVPLTSNFDLDVPAIMRKVHHKTKAILINSPHNPTGAIFSRDALLRLATDLKGSKVTVIADDIYAKLVYDESFMLVPTAGFERLVIVNGFSKSQALTGWRVGYVIADKPIAQAITTLLSHTMSNAALPSQYAALAALQHGDKPPLETLETLVKQRQIVTEAISEMPGIVYHQPGGAFYAFLDIREVTRSSAKWCEQLLAATGVVLVPGEAFHAPGFARLTFVTDETTLRTALDKIREFVAEGV